MEYTEADRFNFLVERDGLEAALSFATVTYKSYRSAVLQSRSRANREGGKVHFASLPEYKDKFIRSYLYLKKQVLDNS